MELVVVDVLWYFSIAVSAGAGLIVVCGGFWSEYVFFFFFSSRRRHTRCSRDWSSDVCSSDLVGRVEPLAQWLVRLDAADEALNAARRAVELSPDDAATHTTLAELLRAQKKWEIGRAACRGRVEISVGGVSFKKKKKKKRRLAL